MPTSILTPGTTPDTSGEIVVVAGAPVTVGMYRDDEELLDHECRGLIYRKDADANWGQTKFSLNRVKPNLVIIGPGTYHVRRSGAITTPTGVQVD